MINKALPLVSLFLSTVLATSISFAAKPTVYTQRAPDHHDDTRNAYGSAVLKLALEATKDEYGDYTLKNAPSMNVARAIHTLNDDALPNLLYATTYDDIFQKEERLTFVPFPLVQGLLGYRVCFYPLKKEEYIQQQINRGAIDKLLHGQGTDWTDVAVLKHNNFPVVEIDTHKSLYKMVSVGRIDLFCRGANEAFKEYNHFSNIDGVGFDRSFVMQYDLPVFFYVNKKNAKAAERVKVGLIKSYENGSLRQLLFKHFSQSLDFVALDGRKFFYLANPYTKDLDPSYKKYYLHPQADKLLRAPH